MGMELVELGPALQLAGFSHWAAVEGQALEHLWAWWTSLGIQPEPWKSLKTVVNAEQGMWLQLEFRPGVMQPAGPAGWASQKKGELVIGGEVRYCTHPEYPRDQLFYHGTSLKTAAKIICEGKIKSSLEVVGKAHHPNGVYSYIDLGVSMTSGYQQGAVIVFESAGIFLDKKLSRSLDEIPVGAIGSIARSATKKHACLGQERIHHPNNCSISHVFLSAKELILSNQLHEESYLHIQILQQRFRSAAPQLHCPALPFHSISVMS